MAKKEDTKLVRMTADVSPYMKGDVVRLDADELKRIDKAVKDRDLDSGYKEFVPTEEEQVRMDADAAAVAEPVAPAK